MEFVERELRREVSDLRRRINAIERERWSAEMARQRRQIALAWGIAVLLWTANNIYLIVTRF